MSSFNTTDKAPDRDGRAIEHDARALLGQVKGYVAVTIAFAAFGA